MHIYVHVRFFFFFFFVFFFFFFFYEGGRCCCSCFRGCLSSYEVEVDPNQVVFTAAFDSDQVGPYSINATSCELIKPDQVSASMTAI